MFGIAYSFGIDLWWEGTFYFFGTNLKLSWKDDSSKEGPAILMIVETVCHSNREARHLQRDVRCP